MATKQRSAKSDEIDMFFGLLFRGYKLYLQRGVKTLERKHAYTCGNYRNRARNDFCCTTHYIRKSVIEELVLNDLRRVLAYVRGKKVISLTKSMRSVTLRRKRLWKLSGKNLTAHSSVYGKLT